MCGLVIVEALFPFNKSQQARIVQIIMQISQPQDNTQQEVGIHTGTKLRNNNLHRNKIQKQQLTQGSIPLTICGFNNPMDQDCQSGTQLHCPVQQSTEHS